MTYRRFSSAVGDKVLQAVAKRLHEAAGDSAIVARLGGDEFVAALPVGADADEICRALSSLDMDELVPHISTALRICYGSKTRGRTTVAARSLIWSGQFRPAVGVVVPWTIIDRHEQDEDDRSLRC